MTGSRRSTSERIPLGRWAEPDEVAPVFVFFASDRRPTSPVRVVAADGGVIY